MNSKDRCKEDYYFYKSKGICVKCRKERAMVNAVYCPECSEKHCIEAKKRRDNNLEEHRRRERESKSRVRQLRINEGKCSQCGKEKDSDKYKMCSYCRAKRRQKYLDKELKSKMSIREQRAYFNLCMTCGKDERVEGKKICKECYEKRCNILEKNRSKIDYKNHIFKRYNKSLGL